MILLASPGQGEPCAMPPAISEEAEPLWLALHNRGWAQPQPHGVRAPSTGLLPAGLRLPQPAQQDCTCSPLPGQQPEIAGRVLAPRRSVAIPVSHIWASNEVANAAGTKPFSSNPIITLLFPAIAIPYGMHSAMQNEFMVSIFIPQDT